MGIPAYFSYIIKNHKNIVKTIDNLNVLNNLYMDCNSIIYDVFHKLETKEGDIEKTLIKNIIQKINQYIKDLSPTDSVILAFDGVAPVAKLEQQRTRRTRSQFLNQINNHLHNSQKNIWNTNAITPGTQFMKNLGNSITNEYKNNKKISVMFFDPGEGEHKIFEHIRNFPKKHQNSNTIIYGLDADLIMLSINHLPISSTIYLFRETPEFIKSIDSSLNPNKLYMIDIPLLSKQIILNMNSNEEINKKQQKNRIYDYIFLCFFLGNDFMPHFPSLNIRTNGIDILLDTYKNTIGCTDDNLTDGKIIYWKNVRKFIKEISDNEDNYLKHEHIKRDKSAKRFIPSNTPEDKENKINLIPTFDRSKELFINPFEDGWQSRYYKILFDIDIDENRKKQICHNFLEALEWTFKYYSEGCFDWRWKYKYDYPPLLQDLIKFIPYFDTEFIKKKTPNPVDSQTQLAYVLPKQSLELIDTKSKKLLEPYLNTWYTEDIDFKYSYCKYFWESHIILPEITVDDIEKVLHK